MRLFVFRRIQDFFETHKKRRRNSLILSYAVNRSELASEWDFSRSRISNPDLGLNQKIPKIPKSRGSGSGFENPEKNPSEKSRMTNSENFLSLGIFIPGIRDFLTLGIQIPGIGDFSSFRNFFYFLILPT